MHILRHNYFENQLREKGSDYYGDYTSRPPEAKKENGNDCIGDALKSLKKKAVVDIDGICNEILNLPITNQGTVTSKISSLNREYSSVGDRVTTEVIKFFATSMVSHDTVQGVIVFVKEALKQHRQLDVNVVNQISGEVSKLHGAIDADSESFGKLIELIEYGVDVHNDHMHCLDRIERAVEKRIESVGGERSEESNIEGEASVRDIMTLNSVEAAKKDILSIKKTRIARQHIALGLVSHQKTCLNALQTLPQLSHVPSVVSLAMADISSQMIQGQLNKIDGVASRAFSTVTGLPTPSKKQLIANITNQSLEPLSQALAQIENVDVKKGDVQSPIKLPKGGTITKRLQKGRQKTLDY